MKHKVYEYNTSLSSSKISDKELQDKLNKFAEDRWRVKIYIGDTIILERLRYITEDK